MQYCIRKVKIIVKSILDPYCRTEVYCRESGRAELEQSWTNTLRCLQQPTGIRLRKLPKVLG